MTTDARRDRHRSRSRRRAHRAREGQAGRAHAALRRVLPARQRRHAGRRPVAVPEERPVAGLHRARRGRAGVGRRRQRVPRLPQRLRRHVRRPRQPGHRRRRQGADGRRHALRRARPRARSSWRRSSSAAGASRYWRFTNSGTESTMDAIHLARGATGNDIIVKIEGTYHGHHDAVMVSVKPPAELMGDRDRPNAVPYGLGYPSTTASQTQPGPVQRRRRARARPRRARRPGRRRDPRAGDDEHQHRPARPRLPASACASWRTAHGVVLIFDEVKTGAAVAAGGATELFGVTPDVVCLAKAICGGLPGGAVGMTEALGALVADGRVRQQGTFNGNPLVMAAAAGDAARRPHPRRLPAAAQGQRRPHGRLRRVIAALRPPRPHGRHGLQGLRRDGDASRSASTATTSRRSTTR